jgi:hypothetical protein
MIAKMSNKMPVTRIPSATAAAIAEATADRVNPGWRHGRPPMANLTVYELTVERLRQGPPMTARNLAEELGWPLRRVKQGLVRAKQLKLVQRVGKSEYAGQYIYGAAAVPGWPLPAADTERT